MRRGLVPLRRVASLRRVCSEASGRLHELLSSATVDEKRDDAKGSSVLALRHADMRVPLAALSHTTGPEGTGTSYIHGAISHEGLPLSACMPLVRHALAAAGPESPLAVAKLNGLCAWVAAMATEDLEAEFGSEAAGAVLAVANGRPRPGHSVLGQGTFRAAEPAWTALAGRFAETAAAEEANVYRDAGFFVHSIRHMADASPEGLAQSGGAMAILKKRSGSSD